ncbi:hypothetical protein K443DRAFT_10641 [Laccaria amethystina LaAM-08-1]|uniref:Uncharacterized protein n=1 Tax=Laccaria amethystina LaAM-08-1 TaxID=1095629 RepID=A0A0C9WKJ2_9AGAR|nr:hypothetical protein K443DRAFT_10641 [Laccaria amethystina LaAM-08-1]
MTQHHHGGNTTQRDNDEYDTMNRMTTDLATKRRTATSVAVRCRHSLSGTTTQQRQLDNTHATRRRDHDNTPPTNSTNNDQRPTGPPPTNDAERPVPLPTNGYHDPYDTDEHDYNRLGNQTANGDGCRRSSS